MKELTPTHHIVLGLIGRLGEASPYDLKQQVAISVGNFWSVPHSQLYRAAEQLEANRLLQRRDEKSDGGRPRKVYRLTAKGRRAHDRWLAEPPDRMPELRDPGLLKIFLGADPRAFAAERAAKHRERLATYEALLTQDDGSGPRGPWLAIESGEGHSREWVRFWERLAKG